MEQMDSSEKLMQEQNNLLIKELGIQNSEFKVYILSAMATKKIALSYIH